jgi:hypothetical protein
MQPNVKIHLKKYVILILSVKTIWAILETYFLREVVLTVSFFLGLPLKIIDETNSFYIGDK